MLSLNVFWNAVSSMSTIGYYSYGEEVKKTGNLGTRIEEVGLDYKLNSLFYLVLNFKCEYDSIEILFTVLFGWNFVPADSLNRSTFFKSDWKLKWSNKPCNNDKLLFLPKVGRQVDVPTMEF